MPLIQLVEILVVVGVVLWLVNRFIPMQRTIKSILNAVVVFIPSRGFALDRDFRNGLEPKER
jgi:hypothetical protein